MSDTPLQSLQDDVQRLLGRCLLRLQHYERALKAIVAHYAVSGPTETLMADRDARIADTARKTLGLLVGELFGSGIVTNATESPPEPIPASTGSTLSIRMGIALNLTDTEFAQLTSDLKDLVVLRNTLVHHFIEQHDLGTLDGCHDARNALVEAQTRIDHHLRQLNEWGNDLGRLQQQTAEHLRSEEFRNFFVNGNHPDGTVYWPFTEIVSALKKAAGELAVDGWVSVEEAAAWISEHYPDQLPGAYGCRSWRQVLHESRIFEIRYFETEGLRSAWYREKRGH
ncbi:OST-HTH/LOTUS domain-containing protein [Ruegeria pomeroyi]|uniref:OST-HTH/LOTUS domain-containing protein n=2 Tax=Ruegeria pomeroyi TaxID=89184 RepID=A0A9Q3WRR8_9RHOB|nr:OST-HTH/LOTUS domain-containing protein [Ruegeria pomeroyi]